MNIVLIGDGFTGSTLPLAKKWAEGGHKVTCFFYVNVGKDVWRDLISHQNYCQEFTKLI